MTKKSLSDLLKEEVNKADAPDLASTPAAEAGEKEAAKAAPEAAAKTTSKAAPKATASRRASRTGAGRRTATSRQTAKPEAKPEARPEEQAAAPDNAVVGIPTSATSNTEAVAPAADLAQRLSALEKDLAAAQKDKTQLEKTVAGLQKDLATQQERLFELKDSLSQAEVATKAKAEALAKTQAELDEAKQTILKLAEAPAPAQVSRRISGVDITRRRPIEASVNAKAKPTYHRGVPEATLEKGQPNPMLTDADIGWVD